MNLVHEALLAQRRAWRQIVKETLESGIAQELPPHPPQRLIFLGVGSDFHAAKLAALSFLRETNRKNGRKIGPILVCVSNDFGYEIVPQRGDWVFGFCHRGQTEVTLNALDRCREVGAFPILAATKGVKAPPFVQLFLPTSELKEAEPQTVSQVSTITGAVCAVTTLLLGNHAADLWNGLVNQKNPNLDELKLKVQQPPTVILGEREGYWMGREVSIHLMEAARVHVPVYGTEEYFQGPHSYTEAMKKSGQGERLWYLCTPDDTRARQVVSQYCVSVKNSNMLAWVSAWVELQWLVLALALNLGRE